ncbi:hypothetical protein ACHAPU_010975 [Fusarium lateritium]
MPLVEVYQGQPSRLLDSLELSLARELPFGPPTADTQALRFHWGPANGDARHMALTAKDMREKFDLWMPEIYAILTEPRRNLVESWDVWIQREDPEIAKNRMKAIGGPLEAAEHGVRTARGVEAKQRAQEELKRARELLALGVEGFEPAPKDQYRIQQRIIVAVGIWGTLEPIQSHQWALARLTPPLR